MPVSDAASPIQGPPPELLAAARDLLDHCEIADIRPASMAAQLEEGASPADESVSAAIELASGYLFEKGTFSNRFEFLVKVFTIEQRPLATFRLDLIVDYRVDDDYAPSSDAAEFVASTTGLFAAYPYAREMLQSMSMRLRLEGLVFGLMRRGEIELSIGKVGVERVSREPKPLAETLDGSGEPDK